MRCLVGIDDTDSSRGYCTTYLAFRIASDLERVLDVLPYPRLVRLNPNIPFKTRGNAAVCMQIETRDADRAFDSLSSKVAELSDTGGGANPAMVFLADPGQARNFEPLYQEALRGVVSPHKVRKLLKEERARTFEAGNGMGVVGAASALAFDERFDHTYELISYRRKENWGTKREIESSSVRNMDEETFPHTFNNYDYQKRKVLVSPHGPDPVFTGVRGDSPASVAYGFGLLRYEEQLEGHVVFVSNQHTDAHLQTRLEWKAYSSGWMDCTVRDLGTGPGGHTYVTLEDEEGLRSAAAYEPSGDLRRAVALLRAGDKVRAYGGVRRPTRLHASILNLERLDVNALKGSGRTLVEGTYIASPRANRHLTKPLLRYGLEAIGPQAAIEGWIEGRARQQRVPA